MRISVIGAGSWGTSVSWLLGGKGHDVRLWSRETEIAEGINELHHNPVYMTSVELASSVVATVDIEEALAGAEAVVVVTPSVGVRPTAEAMRSALPSDTPVVVLSKGVEGETLMLMTEVLDDVLRQSGASCMPLGSEPRRGGRAGHTLGNRGRRLRRRPSGGSSRTRS